MNTGLRRGELFGLKWDNVNLSARLLTVRAQASRNRARRAIIPLNVEAHAVLTRWKGRRPPGLVFPSAEGGRLTNVNKSWAALVTAAELEDFRSTI